MSQTTRYALREDRREPLWDRVDRNRIELALFVSVFVVVSVAVLDVLTTIAVGLFGLMVVGSAQQAITLATVRDVFAGASVIFLALSVSWVVYALSRRERWVVKRFGAEFVAKGSEVPTKLALKDMAIAAGMPIAPALYLIPRPSVNAFVFASGRRRAVCGVTRGFIEKLTLDEQRAVFANLVARLRAGDTATAAGVASIVWPLYAWDGAVMKAHNADLDALLTEDAPKRRPSDEAIAVAVFGIALAVLAALFEAWHRAKQRHVAEKADAEGMLLLKDPRSMLSALQRCIEMDNTVPSAGEGFADLFYCWTGPARNDERDPEWERVARLREVLGVEGLQV